jgi:hypothetical protein
MQETSPSSRARGLAALAVCALFNRAALAQGSPTPQLRAVEVRVGADAGSYHAGEAAGAKSELTAYATAKLAAYWRPNDSEAAAA